MIIILAVVLFISIFLYSEIKVIKNIGDSVVSLYAADSGIEKILFYDYQEIPNLPTGVSCDITACAVGSCINSQCVVPAARGLCSMLDSTVSSIPNTDYCASGTGSAVFCNGGQKTDTSAGGVAGCDPSKCDDCTISFNTTFDNRTYYTVAKVTPSTGAAGTNFEITSKGVFGGAQRQIEILLSAVQPAQAIDIQYACATPVSNPQGEVIDICATVNAPGGTISHVTADIYYLNASGNKIMVATAQELGVNAVSICALGQYGLAWDTGVSGAPAQAYHVDIEAKDNAKVVDDEKCTDISPLTSSICPAVPTATCVATQL
jgi:hypothetical protein